MAISETEKGYIVWQNRFLDFYIAARACHRNGLYRPAAFLSQQSIEQLLKATLVYWDSTFLPEDHGHAIAKLARMIANKVPGQKGFSVPEYFYSDQRYQSVSRYPRNGRGLAIPETFIPHLDKLIADLIEMVPFQFNSRLYHTLTGKDWSKLLELRKGNVQMTRLRKHVRAILSKKYPHRCRR